MGKAIIIPNISFYTNNLGSVTFTNNTSYILKITALENLTISFTSDLEYNTKVYPNWQYYVANTQLVVLQGTTVSFRGNLLPDEEDGGIGVFTISGECTISGNPLGLLKNNTLLDYAFKGLFKNCTSITDAVNLVLPTNLTEGCFEEMFYGCTSLITAPKLLATSLEENCYEKMFYGCTSLNHIICYNLDDISDYVSSDWIYGVSNSGIFEIDYTGDWNSTNKASHIPSGWEIDDDYNKPYEDHYFTVNIITDGDFTVLPAREQSTTVFTTDNALSISYKINYGNWTETQLLDAGLTLNVSAGDRIKFKGTNTHYCNNSGNNTHKQWYVIFGCINPSRISGCTAGFKNTFTSTTASFDVSGNIMSLCYGDNFIGQTTLPASYTFCSLFKCSNVCSAENLILPATTLLASCYRALFSWSPSVTVSPVFATATPVTECYKFMFESCISLKKITCLATSNLNSNAFECWTTGMQNTNEITFIKNPNTTVDTTAGTGVWITQTGNPLSDQSKHNPKNALIGNNWVVQDYVAE